MTSLETRMRQANPIPDAHAEFGDDEIAALLTLTRARSTDMDVKEMTTAVTPDEKRSRGWLIAVAAAAVVVLVVGAVLLLSGGTDDVAPATTPSTTLDASPSTTTAPSDVATTTTAFVRPELDADAVAVVEGMVAAINVGDVDTAVEPILEAEEFASLTSAPEGSDGRSAVLGRWAYWAEIESMVEVIGCTTTTSGTTRCEIARVSQHDYSVPDPELSVIHLRLQDGRIAFMQQEPMVGAWSAPYQAFNEWTYENHRDVGAAMFIDFTNPERSAELMREYYPLWLEQRGS